MNLPKTEQIQIGCRECNGISGVKCCYLKCDQPYEQMWSILQCGRTMNFGCG